MPKYDSIKSQSKFIEITVRHGCSPVNLLHIFRTRFTKNTSERLLLTLHYMWYTQNCRTYIRNGTVATLKTKIEKNI